MSVEEAEYFFEAARQQWEASEPCHRLRSALASTKMPLGIKKIIGFSCSVFSLETAPGIRRRSSYQHALLLTLRDIFQDSNPTCFVQDPIYTDVDKLVLQKHGIVTLSDPKGFLEVDSSSIVFSISSNAPVKQIICDLARPALIIWDRILYNDPPLHL
jgi:SRR1